MLGTQQYQKGACYIRPMATGIGLTLLLENHMLTFRVCLESDGTVYMSQRGKQCKLSNLKTETNLSVQFITTILLVACITYVEKIRCARNLYLGTKLNHPIHSPSNPVDTKARIASLPPAFSFHGFVR